MSSSIAESQVYRLLLESGPLKADLLAKILGLSDDVVIGALEEMTKKGYIAELDDGRYIALPKLTDFFESINTIKEELKRMEGKLKENLQEVKGYVSESRKRFVESFIARTDNILRSIQNVLNETIEIYKKAVSKDIEVTQSLRDTMESTRGLFDKSIMNLETLQELINAAADEAGKKLSQAAADSIVNLISIVRGEIESLKAGFSEILASVDKELDKHTERFYKAFADSLVVVKNSMKELVTAVGDALLQIRDTVEKVASETSNKIKSNSEANLDELLQSLSGIIDEKFTELEQVIETYRSALITQMKNAVSKQDELLSSLRVNVVEMIQKVGPKFDEVSTVSEQNIRRQLDEVFDRITTKVDSQKDLFVGDLKNLDSTFINVMDSIRKSIANDLDNVADLASSEAIKTLSIGVKELRQNVSELANIRVSIVASLKDAIADIDSQVESSFRKIADQANELLEHFKDRLKKIHDKFFKKVQKLTKELSSPQIAKSVEEKITEVVNSVTEKLNSELSSLFTILVDDIKGDLEELLFSKLEKCIETQMKSNSEEPKDEKHYELSGAEIDYIKKTLFTELENDKQRIRSTIKELLTTCSSSLLSVLTNHITLILETIRQEINSKITEAEVSIKDDISWLDSEVSNGLKLLLSHVDKYFHELQNVIDNRLLLVSSSVEKSVNESLRALDSAISNLQSSFDNYKTLLESTVNEKKSEIAKVFEDGTTTVRTTISTYSQEIESEMKSLSDFLYARKETILEAIGETLDNIKTKLKAGLAVSSEGALWEIDNVSKALLNAFQEVRKDLDESHGALRRSLQDLSESTRKTILEAVSSKVSFMAGELVSFISHKEAEIFGTLTQLQENTQKLASVEVEKIDQMTSKIDGETLSTINELKKFSKKIGGQLIQLCEKSVEKASETAESLRNELERRVIDSIQALKSRSQEILKDNNQKLKTIRETLQGKVLSVCQESIDAMSKSIADIDAKLKEQSKAVEAFVVSMGNETKTFLEREEIDIYERIDEILADTISKASGIAEESEKAVLSIMQAIQQYVSELKRRPKKVNLSYGREVLNTLLRSLVASAGRHVLIITPMIDETLEKILLESGNRRAIVEIYTKSKPEKAISNVFVMTMTHIPDGITIAVKDNKDLLILLEEEGKHVGIISEDMSLSKLFLSLIKKR